MWRTPFCRTLLTIRPGASSAGSAIPLLRHHQTQDSAWPKASKEAIGRPRKSKKEKIKTIAAAPSQKSVDGQPNPWQKEITQRLIVLIRDQTHHAVRSPWWAPHQAGRHPYVQFLPGDWLMRERNSLVMSRLPIAFVLALASITANAQDPKSEQSQMPAVAGENGLADQKRRNAGIRVPPKANKPARETMIHR
jgi:hypothetical protein